MRILLLIAQALGWIIIVALWVVIVTMRSTNKLVLYSSFHKNINMKLETILQLLYTNGHQDLVARAVQIDNNIPMPLKAGDIATINIHKSDLPAGKTFKGDSWGNIPVVIELVNPYDLGTPYLVTMPNGKQQWVKGDEDKRSVAEIVDIELLAAKPVDA